MRFRAYVRAQLRAIFGAACVALRAVLGDAAVGYSVVDFIFVHRVLCVAFFGAWCVVVDPTV